MTPQRSDRPQEETGCFGLAAWAGLALTVLMAVASGPACAQAGAHAPVRAVAGVTPTPEAEAELRRVLGVIMARAGLEYRLTLEPLARARANLAGNQYDLDVARVQSFDEAVPGAHIVRPHVFSVRLVALGRPPAKPGGGLTSLQGLHVAFQRGAVASEALARAARQSTPVNSREACVAMVERGRVDVCVLAIGPALPVPAMPDGAALVESVLDRQDYFFWASPARADLAERLSATLQAMELSGELQRLTGANRLP